MTSEEITSIIGVMMSICLISIVSMAANLVVAILTHVWFKIYLERNPRKEERLDQTDTDGGESKEKSPSEDDAKQKK